MADGFESDRTDAYFNGRLKLTPTPKRIDRHLAKEERSRKKSTHRTSNDRK